VALSKAPTNYFGRATSTPQILLSMVIIDQHRDSFRTFLVEDNRKKIRPVILFLQILIWQLN
jgi:hypothetical protein